MDPMRLSESDNAGTEYASIVNKNPLHLFTSLKRYRKTLNL